MSTLSVNIPVPSSPGFGPAVDVSSLIGEKTVILSGTFRGSYVLYGSHGVSHFVPLMIFNAGGVEGIKQIFDMALSKVRLRSLTTSSSGVSCQISGLQIPGNNSFTSFPSLGSGDQGPQAFVDLGVLSYQIGLNFIAQGGLQGVVLVEGSQDRVHWNPLGEFSVNPVSGSLLNGAALEFAPLLTADKIRYVRLNVLGTILDSFVATIGGSQAGSGGVVVETLREAYDEGSSSFDQTMMLSDAKGGKVIFDGSGVDFTDAESLGVLGPYGGESFGVLRTGGIVVGGSFGLFTFSGIQIGAPSLPAYAEEKYSIALGAGAQAINTFSYDGSIAIGGAALADSAAIAIGYSAQSLAQHSIVIGSVNNISSFADGAFAIVIGADAASSGGEVGNVVIGGGANSLGGANTVMGVGCSSLGVSEGNVVIGNGSSVNGSACVIIGQFSGGTIAIGDNRVGIGDGAFPNAAKSIAMGYGAIASGDSDVVIGSGSQATNGSGSVVIGENAQGIADHVVVVGSAAYSGGVHCVSIGHQATSDIGSEEISVGYLAHSAYNFAVSLGSNAVAVGEADVVIGAYSSTIFVPGNPFGHNTIVGPGASSNAQNSVVVGSGSSVMGNLDVAIGSGSQTDDTGENVVVGSGSQAIGHGNVVIGAGASAPFGAGFFGTAVAIGYNASVGIEGIAIGQGAQGAYLAVAVGESTVTGDGAVSIGYQASSAVTAVNQVSVGSGAAANGNASIAIGSLFFPVDSPKANGDYDVVIGSGALSSIGGGNNVVIGRESEVAGFIDAIAIGYGAIVSGNEGMAFGKLAAAGAGEIVFSSSTAGGANLFEVVSSVAGQDLFSFDAGNVGSANTTAFTLLVTKNNGTSTVALPVSLSTPDLITHMSNLQVLNN